MNDILEYTASERLLQFLAGFGLYPRDMAELLLVIAVIISFVMLVVHLVLKKKSENYQYGKLIRLLEFAHHIFAFFFGILIMRSVLIEPHRITSSTLSPEIRQGDHVLFKKFQYAIKLPFAKTALMRLGLPQRGDIVLYKLPGILSQSYVFRVIALPGEHIRYNRKSGEVFINGIVLPQAMAKFSTFDREQGVDIMDEEMGNKTITISKNDREISKLGAWLPDEGRTIPIGSYFGMFDVRDACCDSREIGVIGLDQIIGKAYAIYMSEYKGLRFDRNQFLK